MTKGTRGATTTRPRRSKKTSSKNGFVEYGKWFLGVNDEYSKETRRHYEFPYGDFENVHRCSILAAQSRLGQDKYFDVEEALADLLAVMNKHARPKAR